MLGSRPCSKDQAVPARMAGLLGWAMHFLKAYKRIWGFPGCSDGKGSACHVGLDPWVGRYPGERNGFVTPWTVACQVPLSMWFLRQVYWNGLPFPSLGDLPNPGIELTSSAFPALQMDSLPLSQLGSLNKKIQIVYKGYKCLTEPLDLFSVLVQIVL